MKTILFSAALAAAPVAASAATILVDDFTSRQVVADQPLPAYPRTSEIADAAVLGGYRELSIRSVTGGGPFASTLSSDAGGEKLLNFSNQSGQAGMGVVVYDGAGSAGLGGIDLAGGEADARFRLFLANADAPVTIESVVTDLLGGTSTLARTLPQSMVRQAVTLAFADFTGGADFGRVDSISFRFSGPKDLDASFDRIMVVNDAVSPVPLPAGGVLLGLGLLGLAGLVSRRA